MNIYTYINIDPYNLDYTIYIYGDVIMCIIKYIYGDVVMCIIIYIYIWGCLKMRYPYSPSK